MGRFTEFNLAFTFAPETPAEVLAAFAAWRSGEDAPELADLDALMGSEVFDPDDHLGNFFDTDPMEGLPLLPRATLWRSLLGWADAAYFPGQPATALHWRHGEEWTLTTRGVPKEQADWVQAILAPLGEWATEGTPEQPEFVGYIKDEYTPRPVLIWSFGGRPFEFEGEYAE